jgi:hypothetical protein
MKPPPNLLTHVFTRSRLSPRESGDHAPACAKPKLRFGEGRSAGITRRGAVPESPLANEFAFCEHE